jgi:hypothetical protein
MVIKQQATIDALVVTADRVISARYDRPVPVERLAVPFESIPGFVMNGQGDVAPPCDPETYQQLLTDLGAQ